MKFLLTAVLVSAAAAATTDSARCVDTSELTLQCRRTKCQTVQ